MFERHVYNQLSAYCHDALSQAETQRVAAHLLRCQRCRKDYEEIRFGVQMASQLQPESAPASLWSELELRLEQTENAEISQKLKTNERTRAPRFFTWPKLVIASAALLLLVGSGSLWLYQRLTRPAWEVASLAGQPRIGSRIIGAEGRLAVGEWLFTDEASRARIEVGSIGQVDIEPNSEVKLVAAHMTEHRLSLQRGKLHAFIFAPPRNFFVDTPSAVAVDLGCAYTLEVNDDGRGLLSVTSGWVAFEQDGRESFVPKNAVCVTRPGLGPGTPYFSDATDELQAALGIFDTTESDTTARDAALQVVLSQARTRDALTLWHMLARTSETERGLVYDRLAVLVPPPAEVTRTGILSGDRAMRDAWWEKLDLGSATWWRMWKGPVPK